MESLDSECLLFLKAFLEIRVLGRANKDLLLAICAHFIEQCVGRYSCSFSVNKTFANWDPIQNTMAEVGTSNRLEFFT